MKNKEYIVTCHRCRKMFNAFDSAWCNCLTLEPTLVCPHCASCICKAPADIRKRFWSRAPASLWDSINTTFSRNIALPANVAVTQIKRPLVLIVDHNKQYLSIASQAVQDLGYNVITATDGQEGLNLAKTYMPDLILTDTALPRLDGREMCRLLKENEESSHIKVVIVTGLIVQDFNKSETLKLYKMDDYLNKPLSGKELEATLKKYAIEDQPGIEIIQDADKGPQPKDSLRNFFRRR